MLATLSSWVQFPRRNILCKFVNCISSVSNLHRIRLSVLYLSALYSYVHTVWLFTRVTTAFYNRTHVHKLRYVHGTFTPNTLLGERTAVICHVIVSAVCIRLSRVCGVFFFHVSVACFVSHLLAPIALFPRRHSRQFNPVRALCASRRLESCCLCMPTMMASV